MKSISIKKWKELNQNNKNSLYGYLYYLVENEQFTPDVFRVFREVFWPEFIEYNGFFFTKEGFSEEHFNSCSGDNNPEFWVNMLLISDLFFEEDYNEDEVNSFSKTLVATWSSKLKIDYPNMVFVVEKIFDSESSEIGVTFYQEANKNQLL